VRGARWGASLAMRAMPGPRQEWEWMGADHKAAGRRDESCLGRLNRASIYIRFRGETGGRDVQLSGLDCGKTGGHDIVHVVFGKKKKKKENQKARSSNSSSEAMKARPHIRLFATCSPASASHPGRPRGCPGRSGSCRTWGIVRFLRLPRHASHRGALLLWYKILEYPPRGAFGLCS
jgi:hypothetical protein